MAQFSVGSVEGVPFTACTSGPDVIILASNFARVQQITSSSPISSIDCSTDVGKIAAAYDNKMVIFEPIPLVQQQQQQQLQQQRPQQQPQQPQVQQQQASACTTAKLDYKWVQTATIESEAPISVMSFSLEGTRLIAGGSYLQLWMVEAHTKTNWQCVWRCKPANTIHYLKFSPDGTLFCSAGKSDRLVKIWYESVTNVNPLSASNSNIYNDNPATTLSTPNCLSPPPAFNGSAPTFTVSSASLCGSNIINNSHNNQADNYNSHYNFPRFEMNFSFIYVAHPMPITGLEWRRTSKYTPRGAVANVLITSCKDSIARIWVQTLLPDDGLVNFNQLKTNQCEEDLVNGAPRAHNQRHRQKLLRRLKRMKAFSQFKKRQALVLDHSLDLLEKATTTNNNNIISAVTTSVNQNTDQNLNNNPANSAIVMNGLSVPSSNSNNISKATNSSLNTAMPTALSAHDFHSYALCSAVIKPGLHFHLAGLIEANADLAQSKSGEFSRSETLASEVDQNEDAMPRFVVHWINNKEMHITRSIELLLHDMLIRILRGNNPNSSSTNSPQSAGESCSGSENDTDELDDPNDDTITAESSKKLRHKLCRKMNKQRALAASGRRDPNDLDDPSNHHSRTSLNPNMIANNNGRASPTSLVEEFDKTLELLLKKWQTSTDLLFSIDKSDGTLTLWQLKYLDGEDTGIFRQVQIEKLSRLNSALPYYDATTMSLNVTAYSPSAYLDVKRAYLAVTSSSGLVGSGNGPNFMVGDQFSPVDVPEILSINTDSSQSYGNKSSKFDTNYVEQSNLDDASASSIADQEPSIFIVTQHLSGTLGLWKLNFDTIYPRVQSVDLVTRITGLPIDPTWLRDGTLCVEYESESSSLLTKWIPDETQRALMPKSMKLQSSLSLTGRQVTFLESGGRSTLNYLPSVDEELASKPLQNSMSRGADENLGIEPSGSMDMYRASTMASMIDLLPQYHSRQLIELLAFGKIQRVKAILNHLVNCLLSLESQHRDKALDSGAPWRHRSRTMSIVAQSQSSFRESFDIENPSSTIQQQVLEEIELDYIEVTSIKPLPLYSILDADVEKPARVSDKASAHEDVFSVDYESILKSRSQVDETLDEILGQSTIETLNKQKELKRLASEASSKKGSLTSFNPKKAKLLTGALTHAHLPGLSNVDQMHLLAVADAVALFDASPEDLNEAHEDDSYESAHGGSLSIVIDSLDDRGLRFLTAMRQHVYLTRCLPVKQRNELRASGIGNHNLVWAFHSESQDELISLIPCVQRNKPEWSELREFGVGWWLKKREVLRKLIEKVAQSAYQAKQDPLDAALFYLAMKKKTLVCALLRRVNCDKRILKLFEQDFNDPVNKKKALKNAYALLGLHRFEHAAAFFVLAGSIWDAVEVCINNLNDIQLAIILIRLYDSDSNLPENLRKLLFTEILGSKRPTSGLSSSSTTQAAPANGQQQHQTDPRPRPGHPLDRKLSGGPPAGAQYNYDPKRAHPDPFLRSMAFWKLGDYLSSVHTLIAGDVGQSNGATRPSGANQQMASSVGQSRRSSAGELQSADSGRVNAALSTTTTAASGHPSSSASVSASVFNFYLFLKDQPLVVKHKQQLIEELEIKKRSSPIEEEEFHCHRARSLSSGELGFDERGLSRAIKQSSTEFEVLNETTRLMDEYSDQAVAEREQKLFFSTADAYLADGCPLLALEVLCSEDHLNMSQAQRMKFVACLHILMNELNTLATNADGAPLGTKLAARWLRRSAKALSKVCSYSGSSSNVDDASGLEHDLGSNEPHEDQEPTDSSQMDLVQEEMDSDEMDENEGHGESADEVELSQSWVKQNEPILRLMLTYCNLHSATRNCLTTVRLELLRLLK